MVRNIPHIRIYTDRSKSITGVGSAAVIGDKVRKATLPKHASIFSAEVHAVELPCRPIEESATPRDRFLIRSDSLSMVLVIQNYSITNPMVKRLQRRMHLLQVAGLEVVIMWTPGHSGIQGNVLVDVVAKRAASRNLFLCHILTGTQLSENTSIRSGRKIGMNAISSYISQSQRLDLTSKAVNSEKMRLCLIDSGLVSLEPLTLFSLTGKSKDPDPCAGGVMMRP